MDGKRNRKYDSLQYLYSSWMDGRDGVDIDRQIHVPDYRPEQADRARLELPGWVDAGIPDRNDSRLVGFCPVHVFLSLALIFFN